MLRVVPMVRRCRTRPPLAETRSGGDQIIVKTLGLRPRVLTISDHHPPSFQPSAPRARVKGNKITSVKVNGQ